MIIPAASTQPPRTVVAPTAKQLGTTETALAAQHMTPESRRVLPDALLDARIGRSTLAGSLNDQIRFRVQRTGDVSDWKIVPDSPHAAALMQSRAGERLLQQLEVATQSTGTLGAVSNLQGYILTEDNESVLAAHALARLDDADSPSGRKLAAAARRGDTARAEKVIHGMREDMSDSVATAGAWNDGGWIAYMPDTSRAMLVNAGAYAPNDPSEAGLRKAGRWTKYISGNGPHEVQHSVSGPSPTAYQGAARWMEEGTANVFSRTPTFHRANAAAARQLPEVYAGMLAHEPSFDPGWKPWTRPKLPAEEQKEHDHQATRNYGDSQVVLRDLVRLAGGDFRSTAGKERAFELLQGKSMRYTPGVLATAIIEQHGLDPKVYDRLRERIKVAVDIEGGVAALATEFGIES